MRMEMCIRDRFGDDVDDRIHLIVLHADEERGIARTEETAGGS